VLEKDGEDKLDLSRSEMKYYKVSRKRGISYNNKKKEG
jgi:hypothetical protein